MCSTRQRALKNQARDVKQAVFLAESDLRYAKAIGDTQEAAAAESKLRQAKTEYAAIQAEQRALKAQTKQKTKDAESNRAIAGLNEAVTKILMAVKCLDVSDVSKVVARRRAYKTASAAAAFARRA